MNFSYQEISAADHEFVWQEVYLNNTEYFALMKERPTLTTVKEDAEARPLSELPFKKDFLLIREGEQVIGIIDILFGYPKLENALIGLLLIKEKGCGAGHRVMEDIRKLCQQRGMTSLSLGVLKNNPNAYQFWLSNGFKESGVTDAEVGGKRMEVFQMTCALPGDQD